MRNKIISGCILLSLVVFIFAASLYQQSDSNGIIVYSANITANIRSNQAISTTDTLFFSPQQSLFQWQRHMNENKTLQNIKEQHPNAIVTKNALEKDKVGRINFYDESKDSLFSRRVFLSLYKIYLLKEKTPTIHWNITDSTKKIGDYICTKATTWFRGRNYTAWFTPQIPVPYGPWKLQGLPGLILQAHDQNNDISFRAQKIKFTNETLFNKMPLNGKEKVINLTEYKYIIQHLLKLRSRQMHKKSRKFRKKYGNHVTFKYQLTTPHPMEIFTGQ